MDEKHKAASLPLADMVEQQQADAPVHPESTTPEPEMQEPVLRASASQDAFSYDVVKAELDKLGRTEITAKIMASLSEIMRETLSQSGDQDWQIYTMADAYAPRPPVKYLVSGLFKLPSLSIVYGPPGCLKTMLLQDVAACVALGTGWLPPLPSKDDVSPRATIQAPVLWCDFDNGVLEMHQRIEAVGRGHGLTPDHPLSYVSMPTPWLDASDAMAMEYLGQRMKALGARLLVIDNLRNVSGKIDENSAEIGNVLSMFRRLAEDAGAAVILIHHQRKSTGVNGRAGDTLRGHSSIEAALDLALLIEREEHADTIKLRATKVRGADVLPFGAIFDYEHKPGTDELAKVKFFGQLMEDLTSDAAIKRTVIEIVGNSPRINKGDLTKQVKDALPNVGVNRIRSAIDDLAAKGKLAVTQGDRGAKLYDLPQQRDAVLVDL